MAAFSSWLAAGSLALGAYGMSKSAKAAKQAAQEERVSAEIEATQLEDRAKETVVAGTFNSDRIKQRADKILASQRAVAAARGDSLDDASVRAIRDETLKEASIDQLLVMMEAEKDAEKDRYAAKVARQTGQRTGRLIESRGRADMIAGSASLLMGGADWLQKYG